MIFCDGDELTVALVRVPNLGIEDVPARAGGKIERNSTGPLPAPHLEMVHRPGAAHDVHAEERFQLAAELSWRVLLLMPDVPDRSRLPVRSGDDERSAARKDALEFPQHRGDLGNMLDHIRQNDDAELRIAEWNEA